jgi:hypothetical protein
VAPAHLPGDAADRRHARGVDQAPPRPGADATAEAILAVVDAAHPPRRILLGAPPLPLIRDAYDERLAEWETREAVSQAAQGQ